MIQLIEGSFYEVKTNDVATKIEFDKAGDIKFVDMISWSYDDKLLEQLLSQLVPNEDINFILNSNTMWEKMD